jgi:cbb3-type cytochrome oxidase maturation protein
MTALWLLVPLSVLLVLALVVLLAWAVRSGQFDELELEGQAVLREADAEPGTHALVDGDQDIDRVSGKESSP